MSDDGSNLDELAKQRAKKWQLQLQTFANGGFRGNLFNVMHALEHAPELKGAVRFELFARKLVVARRLPWDSDTAPVGRDWQDSDDVELQRWLQRYNVPVSGLNVVVDAVRARAPRYDALCDYLGGLVWDKTERAAKWLPSCFGAPDTAYTRAIGKKWLISAVARALDPGCQADHVLAFEGLKQGEGKSSALKLLADPWVKESLSSLDTKDASVELAGAWIVELAELAALNRSEVEQVKAFITRRVDKFRAPYGRHVTEQPRRCVFVATTNDERWLRDTTGNRRYWPTRVTAVDREALVRDRDQLWAEAVALYKAGAPWFIVEADVQEAAEREQWARVQVDPWQAQLDEVLTAKKPITTRELLDKVLFGAKVTGNDAKRVSEIMRRWAWASHVDKSGGERDVWWFPPGWTAEQEKAWRKASKPKGGGRSHAKY